MPDIAFILVEPRRAANLGASARALKTMGHCQLHLVGGIAPDAPEAQHVAHGALDILNAARQYPTLPDALHGMDLIIASTAKARHGHHQHLALEQLPKRIQALETSVQRIAVVFGPEDRGLSNQELEHCHWLSTIAMAQPQPSLNLAQAVMLYAWTLRHMPTPDTLLTDTTNEATLNHLRQRLLHLLHHIDHDRDGKYQRWLIERTASMTARDVRLLQRLCARLLTRLE